MPQTILVTVEEIEDTAHFLRPVMITAAFTITGGGIFICDATGGAFAITLPAAGSLANGEARLIIIKKKDVSANAVAVTRAGSDTIDGATTYSLAAQYDAVTLVDDADGDAWNITAAI
jgi:hypothetical protein